MKIAQVDIYPLRLPFKTEFKIARGSVGNPEDGAPHIYVRITDENGVEGWGEARPSHRWSYETEESVISTLRGYLAPILLGLDPADIEGIHDRMDTDIAPGLAHGQPIAKCAVDMALHDLHARQLGVNIRRLFGSTGGTPVDITWIVSDQTPEGAARLTSEAIANGYRGVKVKTGFSPELDEAILEAVRDTGPELFIWADANQGYTMAQARYAARSAARIGIQVLEQPLRANDLHGHRKLVEISEVPIALDESIWGPTELIQAIRMDALDILVIKLSKMAGIHRARQCAEIARAAGIECIGSGLTESPLGFMASTQLYSAFGVKRADLNGPGQFLGGGPGWGQAGVVDGAAHPSDGVGLGINIEESDVLPYVVE
jgi:L-Ala-D/L-Glu epimerase